MEGNLAPIEGFINGFGWAIFLLRILRMSKELICVWVFLIVTRVYTMCQCTNAQIAVCVHLSEWICFQVHFYFHEMSFNSSFSSGWLGCYLGGREVVLRGHIYKCCLYTFWLPLNAPEKSNVKFLENVHHIRFWECGGETILLKDFRERKCFCLSHAIL